MMWNCEGQPGGLVGSYPTGAAMWRRFCSLLGFDPPALVN